MNSLIFVLLSRNPGLLRKNPTQLTRCFMNTKVHFARQGSSGAVERRNHRSNFSKTGSRRINSGPVDVIWLHKSRMHALGLIETAEFLPRYLEPI